MTKVHFDILAQLTVEQSPIFGKQEALSHVLLDVFDVDF